MLSYTPSVRPSIPLPTGAIPSTSQPRKNKRQTRTDTRNLNNSLPPPEIGSVVCQVPGPRVGKYYYPVQPTVCGAKAWLVSIWLWLKGTVTAGTSPARELLLTLEKKKWYRLRGAGPLPQRSLEESRQQQQQCGHKGARGLRSLSEISTRRRAARADNNTQERQATAATAG